MDTFFFFLTGRFRENNKGEKVNIAFGYLNWLRLVKANRTLYEALRARWPVSFPRQWNLITHGRSTIVKTKMWKKCVRYPSRALLTRTAIWKHTFTQFFPCARKNTRWSRHTRGDDRSPSPEPTTLWHWNIPPSTPGTRWNYISRVARPYTRHKTKIRARARAAERFPFTRRGLKKRGVCVYALKVSSRNRKSSFLKSHIRIRRFEPFGFSIPWLIFDPVRINSSVAFRGPCFDRKNRTQTSEQSSSG